MPIYMLVINYDQTVPSDGSPSRQPEHARLAEEMRAAGHYLSGAGLVPPEMFAKRIRRRNNKPVQTDGPFPEAKEVIGGYFVVDCSEAEALAYAVRIPVDNRSSVDARQIFIYPR